jgi:hypothetical protein
MRYPPLAPLVARIQLEEHIFASGAVRVQTHGAFELFPQSRPGHRWDSHLIRFPQSPVAVVEPAVDTDQVAQIERIKAAMHEIAIGNARCIRLGILSPTFAAREKLSYDLYYVDRKSLGLDLLIIAQTVRAIFSLRGR